jgi:hypothetical protein
MPRGQSGHHALAHLLAALSTATPMQAKEPTFPRTTDRLNAQQQLNIKFREC